MRWPKVAVAAKVAVKHVMYTKPAECSKKKSINKAWRNLDLSLELHSCRHGRPPQNKSEISTKDARMIIITLAVVQRMNHPLKNL